MTKVLPMTNVTSVFNYNHGVYYLDDKYLYTSNIRIPSGFIVEIEPEIIEGLFVSLTGQNKPGFKWKIKK